MTAPLDSLVARTAPVDGPVDLVALAGEDGILWEREGWGFAAWGEAARVAADPAAVVAALASIATEGDVDGGGPLAVGALPFDDASTGELIIPTDIVRRHPDGTASLTTLRPSSTTASAHDVLSARGRRIDVESTPTRRNPDGFVLRAAMHHEEWCGLVAGAVAAIGAGELEKVVLAREVTVEADQPFVLPDVLGRLRALYPSCTTFSIEGFIGASPELLVSRQGRTVRSHPLAGTIPRSGDPDADARAGAALLASAKDRSEHAMVVDAVCDTLRPHCVPGGLRVPDAPTLYALRNVSHLGTPIEGVLHEGTAPNALALALELHPTPAVGGTPRQEALDHLAKVEQLDRGRYAGPAGWVDATGDGEFYVAIRSAEVEGNRARMIAGVGVVADSDPADELLETQLKLQALLAALVRP